MDLDEDRGEHRAQGVLHVKCGRFVAVLMVELYTYINWYRNAPTVQNVTSGNAYIVDGSILDSASVFRLGVSSSSTKETPWMYDVHSTLYEYDVRCTSYIHTYLVPCTMYKVD